MKKESPINVEMVYLCSFSTEDEKQCGSDLYRFDFDERRDFLIDGSFAGIAVQIKLSNKRHFTYDNKGVRRRLSLTLVDVTSRCEAASRQISVTMVKGDPYKTIYESFPLSQTDFRAGHTYRLVLRDESSADILDEQVFHVFGQDRFGHPADWYTVDYCGLVREGENSIFRSLESEKHKYINVRFDLEHGFGADRPLIMPEVELRIYYPDGERVETRFVEPECIDQAAMLCRAEYHLFTSDLYRGVFYAELLCMQYPVAGFVFSTDGPEMAGGWDGESAEPLGEYSLQAAEERFRRLIGDDGSTCDDEFEEALNRFILSEEDALGNSCEKGERGERGEKEESEEEESGGCTAKEDRAVAEVSLLGSLDHLTGLRSVKEKLTLYERVVVFNKMRSDKGLPVAPTPLHAMFLGSPGTGKTTVAKMMGVMLRRAGILSSGHVVTRERATLLGQNYNSESEKTLAAIEEAQGGILLIDEAYQLFQPNDSRDPGRFVIETLLTVLADESKRDWMLILAGYPNEMRRMFDMNPGFKSRIPASNIYNFDDFSEPELMEIAEKYLTRNSYSLSAEAREALSARLGSDYAHREKNFGNARHVINMIQTEILPAMAVRVTTAGVSDEKALTEIEAGDIPLAVTTDMVTRRQIGYRA